MFDESFEVRDSFYLCLSCHQDLTDQVNPKRPKISAMNGLMIEDIPKSLQLEDIENQLISTNLLFMKLKKLPKSRMGCMVDRVINVPLSDEQVTKSVKTLPRSLEDSFVVPIQFKRMKGMKNSVAEAFVRPNGLVNALKTLKTLGNPFYKNINIDSDYPKRIQEMPTESSDLKNDSSQSDEDVSEDEEENSIQKFQTIASSDITCEISKCPEIDIIVNTSKTPKEVPTIDSTNTPGISKPIILAPGEGTTPTNIMREKNWEVKAWPCLFPTGRYGLHFEREDPLSNLQYVGQRLYNKNTIFSSNSSYLFAMQQFVEREKLEKNVDVCFQKGTLESHGNSVSILSNHDAFSIFKKIKGTPKFWQAARNELLAMIEALGPFHCFFTLSSAEKRWHEVTVLCGFWKVSNGTLINKYDKKPWEHLTLEKNGNTFTLQGKTDSVFEDWNIGHLELGEETKDGWRSNKNIKTGRYLTATSYQTLLFQEKLHEGINAEDILVDNVPLHEFSETMNESLHDLFNRNLFLVTRMFDSRAKSFIQHILLKTGNTGLNVKNFCY